MFVALGFGEGDGDAVHVQVGGTMNVCVAVAVDRPGPPENVNVPEVQIIWLSESYAVTLHVYGPGLETVFTNFVNLVSSVLCVSRTSFGRTRVRT